MYVTLMCEGIAPSLSSVLYIFFMFVLLGLFGLGNEVLFPLLIPPVRLFYMCMRICFSDDSSPGAIPNLTHFQHHSEDAPQDNPMKRYLQCPAMCRIEVLKKFVRNKYNVDTNLFHVSYVFFSEILVGFGNGNKFQKLAVPAINAAHNALEHYTSSIMLINN